MQAFLYDRMAQRIIDAEIVSMTEGYLQQANESWMTSFQLRYQAQEHDDDAWMWHGSHNLAELSGRADLRLFALLARNEILGVLFLQSPSQFTRAEPCVKLVYVQYVANAPWNRRAKSGPGRLRGVGTSLMACARTLSEEAGCGGRLGLHSLRSSDSFYRQLGFRSFGLDPARCGMTYFELCDSHAMHHFDAVCSATVPVN